MRKDSTTVERRPTTLGRRDFIGMAALTLLAVTTAGATPRRKLGRIRIDDHSLTFAGINKGDVALVELGSEPKDGDLCAAFTAYGALRIRRYQKRRNGDVCLYTGKEGEVKQVFAPGAVVIFGKIVRIERGGTA